MSDSEIKFENFIFSNKNGESISESSLKSKNDLMLLANKFSEGHYSQNSEARDKILKFIVDNIRKVR